MRNGRGSIPNKIKISGFIFAFLLILPLGAFVGYDTVAPEKAFAAQTDDVIKGKFFNRSKKAMTMTIKTSKGKQFIKYNDKTQWTGEISKPDDLKAFDRVKITFKKVGKDRLATNVVALGAVKVPAGRLFKFDELKQLVDMGPEKGKHMLVDARPAKRYSEGHIPTSISIPFAKMDSMLDKLPADKNSLLVFYCGGYHCMLSPKAGQKAVDLGYKNVKVYTGGDPDWAKHGEALLTTQSFVKNWIGNSIILDTRGEDAAAKGHIDTAAAFDIEEIQYLKDEFPNVKKHSKANVFLYSDGAGIGELKSAAATIRGWGYKKVFVLKGGYKGWAKKGLPVKSGDASTSIAYVPRHIPGTIALDEFAGIVKNKPKQVAIVDVRSPEEYSGGKLKGAINLPLEQLNERIGELKGYKEVVIHCSTGMRAEMAYAVIKKEGIKVRFFNDTVGFEGAVAKLGDQMKQVPASN